MQKLKTPGSYAYTSHERKNNLAGHSCNNFRFMRPWDKNTGFNV